MPHVRRALFPAQGHRGNLPSYCSDACRAEGRRAANLMYVRRGCADPKKRAVYYLHKDVAAGRLGRGAGGSGKGRKKR